MSVQNLSIASLFLQSNSELTNNMSLLNLDEEMPAQNYSLVKGLTNEEAAEAALRQNLYIKDRTLHRALAKAKLNGTNTVVLVQDRSLTVIGVATVARGLLHIYVQRDQRRKGVGTMLVNGVKARVSSKIIGAPGIPGWDLFFKKNGVMCYQVG